MTKIEGVLIALVASGLILTNKAYIETQAAAPKAACAAPGPPARQKFVVRPSAKLSTKAIINEVTYEF